MNDFPEALRLITASYEQWSKNHMRQIQKSSTVAAPLYHYTNAAGLTGILNNQQFWFTSYLHLNDPSELRFGIEAGR